MLVAGSHNQYKGGNVMTILMSEESGNIIGARIATARKAKKMTQGELATLIADSNGRNRPYSVGIVSQWELGRKKPSFSTLMAIARTLGVSVAYLSGDTSSMDQNATANPSKIDDESPAAFKEKEIPRLVQSEKIPISEYGYYDKKPVFVVFPNKDFLDQWGILDMKRLAVMTLAGTLSLKVHAMSLYPYEVYSYPSYKKRVAKPIPIADLDKTHQMWIEMNSCDDAVRNMYNGWYIHNQNHSALINISNNLVLTYAGYGVAYRAYKEPYDVF